MYEYVVYFLFNEELRENTLVFDNSEQLQFRYVLETG